MKEYEIDDSVRTPAPVSQPHFDDELTVLTARPVVPLEKINRLKHRRGWLLGGAFAIAMLLGAASALLAFYLKSRNAPGAASQLEVTATAAPAAEPVASESPVVVATESPEVEESVSVTPKKHKSIARRSSTVDQESEARQLNEADELRRIRDNVLVDEWQERRARRVMRQERRRNRMDRYNHRDLSNLDEIFEGRKRP